MEFIDLPVDIVALIYDQLPQTDLKNVRLVCRSLNGLVKLRIPRVFLSPSRANIDALLGNASKPALCSQVHEIVWDESRLSLYDRSRPSPMEAEKLRRTLRNRFGRSPPGTGGFEHFAHRLEEEYADPKGEMAARKQELWGANAQDISDEDAFALYNRLYDEQQKIIQNKEDLGALKRALMSFPALEKVTISSEIWQPGFLFPKYETPWFRSLPPGFRFPASKTWLRGGGRWYSQEEVTRLRQPWDESHDEWRGYERIVEALIATAAHHRVKELIIDTDRETTGISYQLFRSSTNSGYMQTTKLFQTVRLTRLELALHVKTADSSQFDCLHNGLLKTCLSELVTLQHFALSISPSEAPDDNYLPQLGEKWVALEEILPLDIWSQQLVSLKLYNLWLRSDSLVGAVTGLVALDRICFDCVFLDETTWCDTVHHLKSEILPNNARWRAGKPDIEYRKLDGDEKIRDDLSAELREFLHGEGVCPELDAVPEHITGFMIFD